MPALSSTPVVASDRPSARTPLQLNPARLAPAAGAVLTPLALLAAGGGTAAHQLWQQVLSRTLPAPMQMVPTQMAASLAWNLSMAALVLWALWLLVKRPVQTRRWALIGGGAAAGVVLMALAGRAFSAAETQPAWPLLALLGGIAAGAGLHLVQGWKTRRRQRDVQKRHLAAEQASSLYLNQLTGELRGTVHSVLGLADLMAEQAPEGKQAPELAALRRAAESLSQSLSDIDELARAHSQRLPLHVAELALLPLIHDQVNQVRQEAEAKGLQIHLSVAVDTPRNVMADARRLGQVIAHMLNHSVRSTRQGQIQLELRRHPRDRRLLRFVVTDTSISPLSGKLASMAAPFSEAILERARHGTSIGMSLAVQLASLMGGRLSARHFAGRGNVLIFTALLPDAAGTAGDVVQPSAGIVVSDAPSAPARPAASLHLNLAGDGTKAVLLVDDNPSTRALIESMLDKARFRVVSCSNGREALQALSIAPYDIVLMDLHMPELDGMATIQQMRYLESERRLRRTPVIALGDAPFDLERQRCLEAGFDQHLCKPVRKSRLLESISTLARDRSPAPVTERRAAPAGQRYVHRDALSLLGQGGVVDVHEAIAGLGGNAEIYLDAIEQLTPALYNWPTRFRDTLLRGEVERARQMALDMQSILEVVRAVPCAASLGRVAQALAQSPVSAERQTEVLNDLEQHMRALLQCLRQAVDRLREGRNEYHEQERRQNSAH